MYSHEDRIREYEESFAARQRNIEAYLAERQQELAETLREYSERLAAAQALAEERMKLAQEQAEALLGRIHIGGFSSSYEDFVFDSLSGARSRARTGTARTAPTPPSHSRPTEQISPAEAARRSMMHQMPAKMRRQIENYEKDLVTGFIGEVQAARQADPERSDWNIHLGYRRLIMTEQPDPMDVEKVKLSDMLMPKVTPEGERIPSAERAYPFK